MKPNTPKSPDRRRLPDVDRYAAGMILHETSANCRVKLIERSFIGGWWTVREVDKQGRPRGSEWESPATSLEPLRHNAPISATEARQS